MQQAPSLMVILLPLPGITPPPFLQHGVPLAAGSPVPRAAWSELLLLAGNAKPFGLATLQHRQPVADLVSAYRGSVLVQFPVMAPNELPDGTATLLAITNGVTVRLRCFATDGYRTEELPLQGVCNSNLLYSLSTGSTPRMVLLSPDGIIQAVWEGSLLHGEALRTAISPNPQRSPGKLP